ncbi:hypothetical protein LTR56_024603 [Elasticomyces elasticus]|nr:hypothetical protein LTR56_024603 [Elasticomyces elasticus]KAK3622431.1 hypothetical protein LTR22_024816 [Elasticomyces elasticus]KAK4905458.1 hypothetical protein LTR49_025235 [Elasticomyces elasticus]KAK5746106.1 hypothetical protein LTS12_022873 [Elasticomyces elasticus]
MYLRTSSATISAFNETIIKTTTSPTLSPTVTILALSRNGLDQSDAITIVFGIIGAVMAVATIVVGIYFGRRQMLKHNAERQGNQHDPTGSENSIPLDHLDHTISNQSSDASRGSSVESINQGSSDAIEHAREVDVRELV